MRVTAKRQVECVRGRGFVGLGSYVAENKDIAAHDLSEGGKTLLKTLMNKKAPKLDSKSKAILTSLISVNSKKLVEGSGIKRF